MIYLPSQRESQPAACFFHLVSLPPENKVKEEFSQRVTTSPPGLKKYKPSSMCTLVIVLPFTEQMVKKFICTDRMRKTSYIQNVIRVPGRSVG